MNEKVRSEPAAEPAGPIADERTFRQALDIWVNPEIERRRINGKLDKNFRLNAAQILFASPLDASGNQVRLNAEVRAVARYKTEGAIAEGDQIEVHIDRVHSLRLPDDEDPNAGHLTLVRFGSQWMIAFDFTYNRARASQRIGAAREFLQAAKISASEDLLRPAYELLFSSLELAVEAELMFLPRDRTKKHREKARRFTEWVRLGNAPAGAEVTLNRLAQMRASARYLEQPFEATGADFHREEAVVSNQIARVEQRLASHRPVERQAEGE